MYIGFFSAFKKEDPTILPRLLQQMEAKLILDIICKRIAKEKPHIPIFTIHDSIITPLEYVHYLKAVMTEELTKHIGITPSLKTEYWDTINLVKKYPNTIQICSKLILLSFC